MSEIETKSLNELHDDHVTTQNLMRVLVAAMAQDIKEQNLADENEPRGVSELGWGCSALAEMIAERMDKFWNEFDVARNAQPA